MVNTVSLSSDMQSLFLIDDGRAFAFPLDAVKGVYIGSLKGQITAATALDPATDEPIDTKKGKTLKLTTTKAQWTIAYYRKSEVLGIIGATDIDSSLIGATDIDSSLKSGGDNFLEAPSKAYLFDLKFFIVNVRRVGNALEITTYSRQ